MTATQLIGGLYIGDIQDVRQGDTSNFDRVVGVCQDDCSANVGGEYDHFNLSDGFDQQGHVPGEYSYELLSEAIDTVVKARIMRETVLVHCHAKRSRSVAVATAAMAIVEGLSWEESYEITLDAHSAANPTQKLVEDAKRYINERQ